MGVGKIAVLVVEFFQLGDFFCGTFHVNDGVSAYNVELNKGRLFSLVWGERSINMICQTHQPSSLAHVDVFWVYNVFQDVYFGKPPSKMLGVVFSLRKDLKFTALRTF